MLSKFATKRFFLTVGSMIAFTTLIYQGRLHDEWYVIGMLGAIAGNHAEDLLKAWKGSGNAGAA